MNITGIQNISRLFRFSLPKIMVNNIFISQEITYYYYQDFQIFQLTIMQAQDPQVTIKKMLLTTRGQLQPPQPNNCIVFSHQHLHPHQQKQTTKPITLETLAFHRSNPKSLENTSITPTLIQHQIHAQIADFTQSNPKAQVTTVIIDSSSDGVTEKTAQIFKKYTVLRGYLYTLPSAILNSAAIKLSKETEVLISAENIKKQIQYTFKVVGQQQRGFIGEIDASYHMQQVSKYQFYNQAISNVLKCYANFSVQTACPIFINLLKFGAQGYVQNNNQSSLSTVLQFLLPKLTPYPSVNKTTLLINPQFQIHTQITGKSIQYENKTDSIIQKLYKQGFNIVFDLSRYRNQICLVWIAQYLMEWPDQTILSAGLKFKTDFSQFGGEGLGMADSLKVIQSILGPKFTETMNKARKENILKLLSWYQKKIIKVQVKMWKCIKCGKESPETEQSFRKFGKDFCSIDCLRAYKF